jgi:hypothetical protein
MTLPFHYVDLRAFCYETEDESRVETALRTLLPEGTEIERTTSAGHHGDTIAVLSTRLERADEVRHVFSLLRDAVDMAAILEELPERIDEKNSFFLQLDKGAAYRGEIRQGDGITLRAKVEAYPATREAAIENTRDALS